MQDYWIMQISYFIFIYYLIQNHEWSNTFFMRYIYANILVTKIKMTECQWIEYIYRRCMLVLDYIFSGVQYFLCCTCIFDRFHKKTLYMSIKLRLCHFFNISSVKTWLINFLIQLMFFLYIQDIIYWYYGF